MHVVKDRTSEQQEFDAEEGQDDERILGDRAHRGGLVAGLRPVFPRAVSR